MATPDPSEVAEKLRDKLRFTDDEEAIAVFNRPPSKNESDGNKEETKKIRVPVGRYSPDDKDKFYRPPGLPKEKYHIIASGKFADIIAARFDVSWDQKERSTGETTGDGTGQWVSVAIKRYVVVELENTLDGFTRLRREIQISRFHRHENIVRFYEVFAEKNENSKATHIWLVTERMDHTLEKYFEHLRKKDNTPSPTKRDIRHIGALLTQLLRALDYLHELGIMHRDVTPRNIGMNQKEFEIKLLDFGLARETNAKLDHSTNVDTPYIYKPLEVFLRQKYDAGVDIWAAGLVAIEMLGEKLMMPKGTDEEITKKIRHRGAENAVIDRIYQVFGDTEDFKKVAKGQVDCKEEYIGFERSVVRPLESRLGMNVGPLKQSDLWALIKKMLCVDREKRPKASECLKEPFLNLLNTKYEQRGMGKNQGEVIDDSAAEKELNWELDKDFWKLSAGSIWIPSN